jgi:low affinity Fe/Cu permease
MAKIQSNSKCLDRPHHRKALNEWFRVFACSASEIVGSPWAFLVALLTIIIWACSGQLFGFSDTWQLVINTGTTIVTFLIVFLIQNTQNRDARAIHLKLDELINAIEGARSTLIDLEHMSDDELARLQKEFERLRKRADQAERNVAKTAADRSMS